MACVIALHEHHDLVQRQFVVLDTELICFVHNLNAGFRLSNVYAVQAIINQIFGIRRRIYQKTLRLPVNQILPLSRS